ncbi:MAG: hypothetical protein ACJ72N_25220 [Labedaea sp.]
MNNNLNLPSDRPMPEHLREDIWNRLAPELAAAPAGRPRRSAGLPLSVAAVVGVLVVGGVVAFGPVRDSGPVRDPGPAGSGSPHVIPPADPADVKLAKDCVHATIASGVVVPYPDSWRPAAKIDADTPNGFLVIRNDNAAAVCTVSDGTTRGIMGPDFAMLAGRGRHRYANLTNTRPFDYFTAWNTGDNSSIQFGIATDEVIAVSLVGQDNSATPAVVRDGTFAAKIGNGETCGSPTSNLVRATLKNGHVIEGPLCKPPT